MEEIKNLRYMKDIVGIFKNFSSDELYSKIKDELGYGNGDVDYATAELILFTRGTSFEEINEAIEKDISCGHKLEEIIKSLSEMIITGLSE